MVKRRIRLVACLIAVALAVACGPRAAAPAAGAAPGSPAPAGQSVADFYKGKTITIIVGFAPGGGYDTTARLIAKHIGEHIPGNPNVIVENQEGAGSMVAANNVFNTAKPDGLTLGAFSEVQVVNQLTKMDGVQFDARKFGWLGSAIHAPVVCTIRADSPYQTAQDLLRKDLPPLLLGGTAPGADTDDFPKILAATLGANIRLVSGYAGSSPVRLATESHEVDGLCWGWTSVTSTASQWLENNFVTVPIYQAPQRDEYLLARFPNAQRAEDLATDEQSKALIRAGTAASTMQKPLAAPPGVPADRLKALQDAYWATVTDPAFLADAQQAKLDIDPNTGDQTLAIVEGILNTPPELAQRLAEIRR
ncbi:MAG TPA: tripartite tricarboxylate transporter substrate-binding protein [Chloroflexota bacterium]|nr:tripartite tricarboxylate transporter substrate-binding protein [Chloroflexota bacterium]